MEQQKKLTGYPSIDRPWLSRYPKELVESRRKYSSIYEAISSVWENESDVIIDYYGSQITAREFFDVVSCITNAMALFEIKKGDSIVVSIVYCT